ncbi:MAG: methyl-accepting chemotaxis protein [Phycisphaerales bacterium]
MLNVSKISPKNWPIATQLIAFSVVISAGGIITLGVMANHQVSDSIVNIKTESLVSTIEERSSQLAGKIETVRDQMLVLSSNESLAQATAKFDTAFGSLVDELEKSGVKNPTDNGPMNSYLDRDFGGTLKELGRPYRGSGAYTPESVNARAAQRMYIAQNPNPVGSKHELNRSPEKVPYNAIHEQYHPYLKNYVEKLGYYDLFLLNESGDIVYSVFKEADYATNLIDGPFASSGLSEVFREARSAQQGEVRIVDLKSYEPSYGAPAWFIAAPLFEDGNRVGVVALQIPTDYISEILGASIGKTGQVVLVGVDGKVRSVVPNNPEAVILETAMTNDAAVAALSGDSGTLDCIDERGVPVLASYAQLPIDWFDWNLVATIDRQEVAAPAKAMTRGIIMNSFFIGCFVIPLAWFFSRSFAKPIKAIVGAMEQFSQGKLNSRTDLHRGDELGQLATAVNEMGSNLAQVIGEVQDSATEVASAANEIASGAEEMAAGMDEQRGQTSQVSAAVEEMSASVTEVAKKSADASAKSQDGGDQAVKGGATVQETVQGMNAISDTVNDSVSAVTKLGDRSEEIGQIIGVINEIADQTNLLALNAAIEAARAGEHGRGFAVVADEVRKLAERTTNATKEVADSIQSIQEETKLAIERMESGKDRVDMGVGLAKDAGLALEEIVCGAREIVPMIQEIAAAAEEQAAAANEIAMNVERIDAVAMESSQSVSQVAQGAVTLSEKSDVLQRLVSRFEI